MQGFECLNEIMKGEILSIHLFLHLSVHSPTHTSIHPHIAYHPSSLLSHSPQYSPYPVPGLFQAPGTQIELNHPVTLL